MDYIINITLDEDNTFSFFISDFEGKVLHQAGGLERKSQAASMIADFLLNHKKE